MAGKSSKLCHDSGHCRRRSRRMGIARVPHNAQHTAFRQRTRGPAPSTGGVIPCMRAVMLNVRGIDQGYQHIDIEQVTAQGSSSASSFTISDVTRWLSGRTLRSGIPFRVLPLGVAGRSALRASDEMTSPRLFRSVVASSLAAARTSSSMASVVRIANLLTSNILHQMRYVFLCWGS